MAEVPKGRRTTTQKPDDPRGGRPRASTARRFRVLREVAENPETSRSRSLASQKNRKPGTAPRSGAAKKPSTEIRMGGFFKVASPSWGWAWGTSSTTLRIPNQNRPISSYRGGPFVAAPACSVTTGESTNSAPTGRSSWAQEVGRRPGTGFEPVNRGFADLRVEPLHHVARCGSRTAC